MAAIVLAGVLASALTWTHERAGTDDWRAVMLLGQALAALVGASGCFLAVRGWGELLTNRARSGWLLLGSSGLLGAAGFVCESFDHTNAVPSLADWCWIAQQPLLTLGLLVLAWRGRGIGMVRLLADASIVVLAAVALSWSLILEKKLLLNGPSIADKAVALYYPVFDIAHLFGVLALLAGLRDRPWMRRAMPLLLLGVGALILSDSFSSYAMFRRNPGDLMGADLLLAWVYPFIGLAAIRRVTLQASVADAANVGDTVALETLDEALWPSHTESWRGALSSAHRTAVLWLPGVATLSVSAILVAQELRLSNAETVTRLLPVLALLLAIVGRQMMTLCENMQLARKLRSSNAMLERNVDERTRHLATLHGITSTLNTSLDRRTVLRVTLEKTLTATQANGGGIWLREVRRDVYADGAPTEEWSLIDWQGLDDEPAAISLLRDLSISAAEAESGGEGGLHLSPATRDALQSGLAPPSHRLILVPVRWQGTLLGAMGLMRLEGSFSYEDRALIESVALEAGTALQNARLYSEVAHRADRDSVTELFNHRAVQEKLGAALSRCRRVGGKFSILMLDLNNFKFFNDTYGHPVGDDVLRAVAQAMVESCRSCDVLGRYGGDEFIALLPDTDGEGAFAVCQRIQAALDTRHFEPVPGTRLPITTAFGWATFPHDGDNALELLTAADQNLYSHKRGGASFLLQRAQESGAGREEVRRLRDRNVGGSFGVLDALVTAIDNKDHYTRHHSEEVTYLSLLVARELGYDEARVQAVRISGLLHDVGKIAVPDDILRHPGKLGHREWEIMQQHPVFGALIVKDVPHLDLVLEGIRYHHEKWDGTGYPEGLTGETIPEMGRLLALADCYSALTTDRPYRKGWSSAAALREIEECAGTHFDPRLCEAFLRVMKRELATARPEDYGLRLRADQACTADVSDPTLPSDAATSDAATSDAAISEVAISEVAISDAAISDAVMSEVARDETALALCH